MNIGSSSNRAEGKTMAIIHGDFSSHKEKPKKNGKEKDNKPAPLYQLHVSLTFSDPLIWRRILVPGEITLHQLHQVLQLCMGWSGTHKHQFYVGKIFYDMDPAKNDNGRYHEADYDLQTLEEAMKWCFIYLYDAGDGWEHEIALEESVAPQLGQKYPVVVDGEYAAPPEDIGGVHGYTEFLSLLENSEDKARRRIVEERNLSDFDPFHFDCRKINDELKEYVWTK